MFFSSKKVSSGNEPVGIIAGLGNPGQKYEKTRHNMGFMAMERLLEVLDGDSSTRPEELTLGKKFQSRLWRAKLPNTGHTWLFVTPMTYMNLSGDAVQPIMAWYKLAPEQLLVIHDELDLLPGRMMLKTGGGLAGHNGLKSIAQRLGNQNFHRLRLGIGRPEDKNRLVSYVTEKAAPADMVKLEDIIQQVPEAIFRFDAEGPTKAATSINKRPQSA